MGYLDETGLARLWDKIKAADTAVSESADEGIEAAITRINNVEDLAITKIGETNENVEAIEGEVEQLKKSVSDGKSEIASAITSKGVPTEADAAFSDMAANIIKIQGSGSPYFYAKDAQKYNLNFYPNINTKIKIKFAVFSSAFWAWVFGCIDNNGNGFGIRKYDYMNIYQAFFFANYNNTPSYSFTVNNEDVFEIEMDKNGITINGEFHEYIKTPLINEITDNAMALFGLGYNGYRDDTATYLLYYFDVYEGSQLVHSVRPETRGGEAVLVDQITGQII